MTDTSTATDTPAPAPNEAPATTTAQPSDTTAIYGELGDIEHALGNVLRAVADLDANDTRRVLLAAAELYDLHLHYWHGNGQNVIAVSDAVKLIEAARGAK